MKNAILMCRVSSDEQAKGYSLNIQKEQLERYCLNNNITIVSCFKEDHSAKNFNRPAFEIFLKSMQQNNGKVDTLLVTSWDRFFKKLNRFVNHDKAVKKVRN
jgi:site-specific DNA recombinase